MILSKKRHAPLVSGDARTRLFCVLIVLISLFALPGCGGGPSKEEQSKLDVQGKQTNEEAMKRMMQEQGKPVPPTGGQGTGQGP
jgi:hypothetical protein